MNLVDIYAIVKQAHAASFYHPDRLGVANFIYINDASVVLRRIDTEKIYGVDYFFDDSNNEKELTDEYDKLIKQVCKVNNFSQTYNNIKKETWAIELNGVAVYWNDVVSVVNPSSLWVYMPLKLNPFDFEMNLCEILNDTFRGSITSVEKTIRDALNIKTSTFQDFVAR